MASSSRPKFRYKNPQEMPHRSQNGHPTVLQTSLTLGNQLQARWLHSDSGMSASGKAVHMELSKSSDPAAERTTQDKEKEVITDYPSNVQQIYMAFQIPAELSVWDVVKGNVNHIANIMKAMQERPLALLKVRVRELVEEGDRKGNCEFQNLHKFIQDRSDLTHTMLLAAHHVQLEILVAIKTGVPAFLHENLTIPKSNLVEIFFYQRCRNISCGNPLPAEGCDCLWCSRRGFCNLCMCLICDKYDFNYNTCRWIGCAGCSHWTHAECAVREGKSRTALAAKNGTPYIQTLYSCMACQETSEMFGFVKDVVQKCGKFWDRDTLLSELECVHKMFSASIDPKGKKFFMKCAELIERLKTVPAEPMSPNILLQALEEIEQDDDAPNITRNEEPVQPQNTDPQNASNGQHSGHAQASGSGHAQAAVPQPMEIATGDEISVAPEEVDLQVIEEDRMQYKAIQKRRRQERGKVRAAEKRLRKKREMENAAFMAAEQQLLQLREPQPNNATEQLAIMSAQQQLLREHKGKDKVDAEWVQKEEAEKLMKIRKLRVDKAKNEKKEKAMAIAAEKERQEKEKAEAEEREKAMAIAAEKEKAETMEREKAMAIAAEKEMLQKEKAKAEEMERLQREREMVMAIAAEKEMLQKKKAEAEEMERLQREKTEAKERKKAMVIAVKKERLQKEKAKMEEREMLQMEKTEAEERERLQREKEEIQEREKTMAITAEKERLQKVKAAFRAWVQREHAEVQERKKAMSLAAAEKERVEQKTKTEAEISGKALAWYTQMQLMKENAKKLDERIIAEQLRSKQEVEEMERAVNMKAAEAEMFRVKAEEAKKEAEQLKTMAMAKKQIHTVAEKTYTDWYLKHRMEEAEAEKRFLFHSLRSYEESINQQLALSLAPPVATTSTPAPPPPSVMVSAAAAAAAAAGPSGSGGCGGGALLSRIMEVLNRMPPRAP